MDVITGEHTPLPPHKNTEQTSCQGVAVVNVTEDVGLIIGTCPQCKQMFVYLLKDTMWELESEFESALQEKGSEIEKTLRSL